MRNYLTRRNEDFGFNLFDAFDDFFKAPFYSGVAPKMRTDIKETENGYELAVDMPGFDKADINLTLDNGYLTINAKKQDKEEDGKYVHRERSVSCSRSFYVGENVTEEDIKARYENGTLNLSVPKTDKKQIEKKNIVIE